MTQFLKVLGLIAIASLLDVGVRELTMLNGWQNGLAFVITLQFGSWIYKLKEKE